MINFSLKQLYFTEENFQQILHSLFSSLGQPIFILVVCSNPLLNASSNNPRTPFPVNEEHSIYLPPSSFANFFASSKSTRSSLSIAALPTKSVFIATTINGISGQWCRISGHHLVATLSNDAFEVLEKQIKNTFVLG